MGDFVDDSARHFAADVERVVEFCEQGTTENDDAIGQRGIFGRALG